MSSELICWCGHLENMHAATTDIPGGRRICFYLGIATSIDECPCIQFKADNLRYLESLSDKS